jgi:hypothetical protein
LSINLCFTSSFLFDIKVLVLFGGLERIHTFLVPIINPPFADNSPLSFSIQGSLSLEGIRSSIFQSWEVKDLRDLASTWIDYRLYDFR